MRYILFLCVMLGLVSNNVEAQMPQAGEYRIIKDTIAIKNVQWSLYCGTHDVSVKKSLNERLKMTVKGKEWIAKGRTRRFGSRICEGRNKTLSATSRTIKNGRSILQCASKRVTLGTEKGVQKVWFEGDKLFSESKTTLYFKDRGDDCVSQLIRKSTAALIAKAVDAPVVNACKLPGELRSLKVVPQTLLVKAVSRKKYCLSIVVKDDAKCTFKYKNLDIKEQQKFKINLENSSIGVFDKNLCFKMLKNMNEEMLFGVIVRYGKLKAESTLHLLPKKQNKARKSWRELARQSKSAVVKRILAEVTQGKISINQVETEVDIDENTITKTGLVFGIMLVLLLLIGFSFIFLYKRKKKREVILSEAEVIPEVVLPQSKDILVCPQCTFQFEKKEHRICPFDGEKLVAQKNENIVRKTMFIPAAGGMICPECHNKYPKEALFCGKDGNPLLPDFGQYDAK